jgi:uncharacterized membrane protein
MIAFLLVFFSFFLIIGLITVYLSIINNNSINRKREEIILNDKIKVVFIIVGFLLFPFSFISLFVFPLYGIFLCMLSLWFVFMGVILIFVNYDMKVEFVNLYLQ